VSDSIPALPDPVRDRLAHLPIGGEAVVRRLSLPRQVARRLLELGLLPGTRVKVVRVAPLGDPMELRLRNYHLSLRREEALHVEVEAAR
jgi:Fe2+ transport system protein FeoA